MGAAGGAVFMGSAFNKLASGLKEALKTLEKFGPHKGLPSAKDIPLLMKALDIRDEEISSEAHRALVWVTKVDVGPERAAWEQWWREHGVELAKEEQARESATELFYKFRGDVLTGKWDSAASMLSRGLIRSKSLESRVSFFQHNATLLRQVYRDARVTSAKLTGGCAFLDIDWGESGFEINEVSLICEEGDWKFKSTPWGKRVVRRVRHAVEVPRVAADPVLPARRAEGSSSYGRDSKYVTRARQRHQMASAKVLVVILALIGGAWAFFWLAARYDAVANLGGILAAIAIFGSVPISLFYCMFFGRMKRSREIRHELKVNRGGYSPTARRLR